MSNHRGPTSGSVNAHSHLMIAAVVTAAAAAAAPLHHVEGSGSAVCSLAACVSLPNTRIQIHHQLGKYALVGPSLD